MKDIEEQANEKCGSYLGKQGYILGATEQRNMDNEIIKNLIHVLEKSKLYHMGITALDDAYSRRVKMEQNETALIREINETIILAKEAMEE